MVKRSKNEVEVEVLKVEVLSFGSNITYRLKGVEGKVFAFPDETVEKAIAKALKFRNEEEKWVKESGRHKQYEGKTIKIKQ